MCQLNRKRLMPKENVGVTSSHPIYGLMGVLLGAFMFFALLDYQPEHSHFYQISPIVSHQSRFGFAGMYFCFYACRWFGAMVWLLPLYTLWIGIHSFIGSPNVIRRKNLLYFFLSLLFGSSFLAFLQSIHWIAPQYQLYSAGKGGIVGNELFQQCFAKTFGTIGCGLLLFPITCFCITFAFSSVQGIARAITGTFRCCFRFIGKCFVKISLRVWKGKLPKIPFGFVGRFFFKKLGKWLSHLCFQRKQAAPSECPQTILNSSETTAPENFASAAYFVHEKTDAYPTSKNDLLSSFTKPSHVKQTEDSCEPISSSEPSAANEKQPTPSIQILASETLEKATQKMPSRSGSYQLPSLQLLEEPPPVLQNANTEDYYETAKDLVQKLAEFGVEVKVEAIQSGPVITRYEVTPARGVRVEKITTLDKNIALGLKALSVRIQAPVPGKGCVGIEVPNKNPLPVCLREILASKAWEQSDAEIPIVLGKEVTGKPIVADLTKMPHLLIAGSTGSGKTVCINAIIASLLFRATPKNLRFIMVDPKIVEMKIYNDLPHMLIPVVTDPKRVPNALKWLIAEMERRYQLFARYGARNIATFNAKCAQLSREKSEEYSQEHLPYIVCIIDELADLMMVAPGDIETSIARLAQLARAAGIHLIIATQRPSVNVITGIIKANLPSRIAFKVASKVDSRTILDMGGADSLIGKGDMLFVPPGASQLIRAQGAWVSDDEINHLVEFLKCNGAPIFAKEVQQMMEQGMDAEDENHFAPTSDEEEPLLPQAIEILKTADRISTSLLQRRLKIGYNRAARIMDMLEKRGLLPHTRGIEP